MDCPKERAVPGLPDELLVDILSRVPAESLRELKLVCRAWRALITDPFNRKRLPQTLEGFFLGGCGRYIKDTYGRFTVLSGGPGPEVDPSFSFLTKLPWIERMALIDSCNGLLLFKCARHPESFGYIVCNPATKEWVFVPSPTGSPSPGHLEERHTTHTARIHPLAYTFLMFDPAVSSHFRLVKCWQPFQFQGDGTEDARGMRFYSSESRGWSDRSSEWKQAVVIRPQCGTALVDGMLHFVIWQGMETLIVAVDGEGKTCSAIHWPEKHKLLDCTLFIGQSQGRLYCISVSVDQEGHNPYLHDNKLSVWVLQDYDTQEWILKLDVSCRNVFGRICKIFDLAIVAIHPDRNVIFFVQRWKDSLASYDMDSGKLRVLQSLANSNCSFITPYVPYFMESEAVANKY